MKFHLISLLLVLNHDSFVNRDDSPKVHVTIRIYAFSVLPTTEDQTVHLGVQRHIKGTPNTDEKIYLGRRTAYSLMGAGFHGKSGL